MNIDAEAKRAKRNMSYAGAEINRGDWHNARVHLEIAAGIIRRIQDQDNEPAPVPPER